MGQTRQAIPKIREQVTAAFPSLTVEVGLTERPFHAPQLVRNALVRGATYVLSCGGDGTHSEVVNGFFSDLAGTRVGSPDACLVCVPCGTGGDLIRTLGVPKDLPAALALAGPTGHRVRMDVGIARYAGGAEPGRYFVNVASAGLSAEVCWRANHGGKATGGFVLSSVCAWLGWANRAVVVSVDGAVVHRGGIQVVAVGNGKYYGGGMMVVPAALVDDGALSLMCTGDTTRAEQAATFLRRDIYSGAHVRLPKTVVGAGARVDIAPAEAHDAAPVRVEVDGETPGALPMSCEVVPHALWVAVSPTASGLTSPRPG